MLLPVLKKELKYYAASPLVYVAGAVFLGLAGYFFYTNLIMLLLLQGSGINVNVWEYTINDIRLLVLLLIPVISMRMLAEEKRLGTIELLCTSPLHEWDIVLGKYCAGMCVIGMLVCATLLFPLLFSVFYPLEHGQLYGAYLGLMLMCCALMAAGVFWSSVTESQIVAAVATLGFTFLLWFMDQYDGLDQVSGQLSFTLLSLQKRFYNFNRGVVTLRDTAYFAGFAILFIVLAVESLKQRKYDARVFRLPFWGLINVRGLSFALHAAFYSLCFLLCVALPGIPNKRFDLTAGKQHSSSVITAQALARLDDTLLLSIGCERLQKYQYEDFLEQLTGLSPHFMYRLITIDRNPVAAEQMEIAQGGSGVAEYRGRKKKIARLNEESLVAALRELMQQDQKTVRIIAPAPSAGARATPLFVKADKMLIDEGFLLETVAPDGAVAAASGAALLMVRDIQGDLPSGTLEKIGVFFEQGGNVLMMLNSAASPNIAGFLKKYNIDLGTDLIIDRQHGGAGLGELNPLVFFNKEHPAAARCEMPAVFNRARSVQVGTNFQIGYKVSIICSSGRATWAEADIASACNGTATFASGVDAYGPVAMGVSVERSDSRKGGSAGRMIVLGSDSFMTDDSIDLLGNGGFAKNIVAWLTDQGLLPQPSGAKPPASAPPPIRMTDGQARIFFWSAVVMAPMLFMLAGLAVVVFRRLRQ
jgi:ABC-2 type transport system permease protein